MSKELECGKYGESPWFAAFVKWVDTNYPGSGQLIEAAAIVIPWDKLSQCVMIALADWQKGMDFLSVLKDALSVFIDFVPYPDGSDGFSLIAKK